MTMYRWVLGLALMITASGCGQPHVSTSETQDTIQGFADTPFWETSKPIDATLSRSHSLYSYFSAARAKQLPLNYFRDLISHNARVSVRYAEWPAYQPYGTGGTIYHPKVGQPFSQWLRMDWAQFYNELFHAWWNSVFTRHTDYASDRQVLFTSAHDAHYRRAHPRNPRLAQEEAYSETVATLMIYMYPQYNPHGPEPRFYDLGNYLYDTGRTVSAVSHSDRPGYTDEAETTYPSPAEYAIFFRQLADETPPAE